MLSTIKNGNFIYIFVYILFIFTLTHIPNMPKENIIKGEDKIVHIFLYLPLGWLLMRYLGKQFNSVFFVLCFVVFIGAVLGSIDEFTQGFVPGRDASVFDTLADVFGVFIGATSSVVISKFWRRNNA